VVFRNKNNTGAVFLEEIIRTFDFNNYFFLFQLFRHKNNY